MKLTPLPAVALFALGCLGETSGTDTTAIPPMEPPDHSGTVLPPMPPPRHSNWVTETGGSGHSSEPGGHTGHSGTSTGHSGAAARTSPPPLVRPVR